MTLKATLQAHYDDKSVVKGFNKKSMAIGRTGDGPVPVFKLAVNLWHKDEYWCRK